MPRAIPASRRITTCDKQLAMRFLPPALIVLIIAIQYPLWLGKGSWLRVWEVNQELAQQKEKNATLVARNAALDADVRDLKEGIAAVEERARVELGMVKPNEQFYQVIEKNKGAPAR
jgi:cell division protein FtsB